MDDRVNVSLEELEEFHFVTNQSFRTEDECFEFYNSYARSKGFSVRKDDVKYRKGSKEVIWRRYVCSSAGYRPLKSFERINRKREPKALTRCGCGAKLVVMLCDKMGIWFVKEFQDGHNHPFAEPQHVFVLRSHRRLSNPQKAEAIELGLGGLRTFQVMDVMEKNYGGTEDTGFLLHDLYNFFSREKKARVEGMDANYFLNHMRAKQEQDPEFFFKYSLDSEGRLKNVFWSDAQSQIDYGAFGDVVVFDSTYRVNRYNLPFVPFVGVDHHRSTIVFGCGVISDETISSYVWLLEAFLEAMNQKHPMTLITDGDAAMARAIEIVMPNADHRLCSWHIERNMVRYLRDQKLSDFRKFIYHAMDVDEFERRWIEFTKTHNITEDDLWTCRMYALRKKWAAAYTKGRRFLGMQSNQRSESLNSTLHKHLKRTMSLVDLMEHYEYCLSRIRRHELDLDARGSVSIPFTAIGADQLEKRAACIFTKEVFPKVREQINALYKWDVARGATENGRVRYVVGSEGKVVHVTCSFDGSSIVDARCNCRMLECEVIPCSHIFAVIKYMNLEDIPPCCIGIRWTMEAKSAFLSDAGTSTQVWSEQMDRYHNMRRMGNLAFFQASFTVEGTERMMRLFDDVHQEEVGHIENRNETSFGPLPAHFSRANKSSTSNVLDPSKIITKGAPSTNKRWKSFQDYMGRK